jgi:hypothetical protein
MLRIIILILLSVLLVFLYYKQYKQYEGFDNTLKCPDNMKIYGQAHGGFCCPVDPTNPDPNTGEYTVCPALGGCKLNNNTPGNLPVCDQPSNQNMVIPSVSVSGTAYDAMSLQQRSELLKDIQQVVKNEILANRQTEIIPSQSNTNSTDSTQQGKEYNIKKQNTVKDVKEQSNVDCPLIPDMSEYIRKDAIPCWNCTLDY